MQRTPTAFPKFGISNGRKDVRIDEVEDNTTAYFQSMFQSNLRLKLPEVISNDNSNTHDSLDMYNNNISQRPRKVKSKIHYGKQSNQNPMRENFRHAYNNEQHDPSNGRRQTNYIPSSNSPTNFTATNSQSSKTTDSNRRAALKLRIDYYKNSQE